MFRDILHGSSLTYSVSIYAANFRCFWSETTNIVPSVDSGLLAINFYTPSKFISPCLMPQIARKGVKLQCKKIWVPNFF